MLRRHLAEARRKPIMMRLIVVLQIVLIWVAVSFAQDAATESRKHIIRGITAVEIAKSEADLQIAADEFRQATVIAPNYAPAWLNLGKVQGHLGQFADAASSYKRYLALAPTADDAAVIRDEIIKMEFRQEQAVKVKSRAGTWVSEEGTMYQLAINGNRMTLITKDHHITDAEAVSIYPIAGSKPILKPVVLKYNLGLQGNKLAGLWSRAAFHADACLVPEDNGEVTGEILDAEHTLILRYTRTGYRASTEIGLLTDDSCREVAVVGKNDIEQKFFGPLPKGGIGAVLGGIHFYWPGGFSMVQYGWSGHLTVTGVIDGYPAAVAGLRAGDEIIAIDNAAVKSLSASNAIRSLRGEPGTEVVLSIMRAKELQSVRIRRVALSKD
jgi:hypothetical protein